MTKVQLQRLTGSLFILGAVLINIPYTLLIVNFGYPDILREPAGDILTKFHAGGAGLILTWLAFAWVGLPLFFAIIMLQRVLERDDTPYLWVGTLAGTIGATTQMIGLLRWTFVVPVLARTYFDPATSDAARETVGAIFQTVHQYGGVVIGEHIGQSFTILWVILSSLAMLKSRLFRPWVAWLGIFTSIVYLSAQTELLAIVIPGFPVVPQAGLIGSLLWLAWMVVIGVFLVRAKAV